MKKTSQKKSARAIKQAPEGQRSQVDSLRWSIGMAAREFGIHPKTVTTRIAISGVLPGDDGRFSTVDIHNAICGDYEKERTRKMKEDADQAALQNARDRGEVADLQDILEWWDKKHAELKQIVLGFKLSDADKDAMLNKLREPYSKSAREERDPKNAGA